MSVYCTLKQQWVFQYQYLHQYRQYIVSVLDCISLSPYWWNTILHVAHINNKIMLLYNYAFVQYMLSMVTLQVANRLREHAATYSIAAL